MVLYLSKCKCVESSAQVTLSHLIGHSMVFGSKTHLFPKFLLNEIVGEFGGTIHPIE